MKPEGTNINTFLEGYLVSGGYDHTVYDPVKDFISGLLDITIIKPIIECFTGEDLITGATLSDLERALKLGGAIVDLFTLGQAMVLTKGAGLGAKAIGKTVILELASNAAVYSVGYGCDALGMPVVASWGLSILTGCTVSAVGGKYLFKDSSGNVIKECTSLEAEQILKKGAELDGNIKSYADWMLPKDAEVFLQYKATGSLDGLSEADINSIRKLEELIELKQVEYQDIFNVRNKDEVLARNSKVHRVEDVVGDGGGVLNEDVFTRYMPDGSKVTNFSHLPGNTGIEVPRRLSVEEMTYLTQEYGVEFAQVYQRGGGINGGGGKYFIYSGDVSSVKVPINKDVIIINHTHPGGTAYPSLADKKLLSLLEQVGSPQKISEIIPIGNLETIKFGVDGVK